ncbi:MAG: hypothetical protein VB082_09875 [Christensenella sp.]|nr:hypothetical protein [Christensenella sp.]
MGFFQNITGLQIVALVLLAVGAAVSFGAKAIAKHFQYRHADLVWKFVGLGIVIAGFIMVFAG